MWGRSPFRGERRALYSSDRLILMHCVADTNMYAKEEDMKTLSWAIGILIVFFASSTSLAQVKVLSGNNEFLGYYHTSHYDSGVNSYIEVYNPTWNAVFAISPHSLDMFCVTGDIILFSQINCFGNLYMRYKIVPYVISNNGNFYRTTGDMQIITARSSSANGTCTNINENVTVHQLEVVSPPSFTEYFSGPLKFNNESGMKTVVVPLGN